MQGSRLEKLFFAIELIDKVTKPSQGVSKSLTQMQSHFRDAAKNIAAGGTSIFGAFAGVEKVTRDAREFNKALNTVASLGASQKALDSLGNQSKIFVSKFGGSSIDFVNSAYDIQSAIQGLTGDDLAIFTYNANVLAKATKATSAEITSFMGNMVNVFSKDVAKMGKATWIEDWTGKTAKAVEMFKTTGPAMQQAFANLGNSGALLDIDMSEQMAVLGQLQSSGMQAAVSGTAYKGFMENISKAQGKGGLDMSFKDQSGNLLPMYEIVGKIEEKFGNMATDERMALMVKAFGAEGAKVVNSLTGKTQELQKNIETLQKTQGNEQAVKMAKKMADSLEVFSGVWQNLKISFGASILPIFNISLKIFSGIFSAIAWLIDVLVPLRWAIGIATFAFTSFIIALGVLKLSLGVQSALKSLTLAYGILNKNVLFANAMLKANAFWHTICDVATKKGMLTKQLSAYWNTIMGLSLSKTGYALSLNTILTHKLTLAQLKNFWATKLYTVGLVVANMALKALQVVVLLGAIPAMIAAKIATLAWAGAVAIFNAILSVNPIILIIFGIVALIAAIILCIKYWDKIKEAFQVVSDFIKNVFFGVWNWICGIFDNIIGKFSKITEVAQKIGAWFKGLFSGNDSNISTNATQVVEHRKSPNEDLKASGIGGNTTNYGGVTINAPNGVTPGQLEEWQLQGAF